MTRAARSGFVFGVYLVAIGGVLIALPNALLALLGLPSSNEPWIHVLGIPVMAIGLLHVASARAELVPFFRASVRVRIFVLVIFTTLAALRIVPQILVVFGIVDAAAALWTHLALRSDRVAAEGATRERSGVSV